MIGTSTGRPSPPLSKPGSMDPYRALGIDPLRMLADIFDPPTSATSRLTLPEQLETLRIKDKTPTIVPLRLNQVQLSLLSSIDALPQPSKRRLLILKARQMGVSTLCQAYAYRFTRNVHHSTCVTVSHDIEATEKMHQMQKRFLKYDPDAPVVRSNSIRQLDFEDTSTSHYIGTAGSRAFGRGDTLHLAHLSELAFWPHAEDTLPGILEALTPDSLLFAESTPNGVGGKFYELWQEAPENGWTPLFFPWWNDPTYHLPLIAAGHEGQDEILPLTEEESALVTLHSLSLEQIKWRRERQRDLKEVFKQEYPEDPISCFLASGRPYFTPAALNAQQANICDPESDNGVGLRTWTPPKNGHVYVAASDPAEGLTDGDFSVTQILDVTGRRAEQVAVLRGKWPVAYFARASCLLAASYNDAVLAPERNNHGHAFINEALNLGYSNLYQHEEYDLRMGELTHKWGWPTNSMTKPVMLGDLDDALNQSHIIVHDSVTLQELRTMSWNGKGGVEANSGCHDDTVMTLGIALQVRKETRAFTHAMDYFALVAKKHEENGDLIEGIA